MTFDTYLMSEMVMLRGALLFCIITFSIYFTYADVEIEGTNFEFCVQALNLKGLIFSKKLNNKSQIWVNELIKKSSCPIFQVQQVWHKFERQEIFQQPNFQEAIYFDSFRKDGKNSGIFTLLKREPLAWGSYVFNHRNDTLVDYLVSLTGINKGFGFVKLKIENRPLTFINIDLHSNSEKTRIAQLSEFIEWFSSQTPIKNPIILTGSLNIFVKSLEWRILTRVLRFKDAHLDAHKHKESLLSDKKLIENEYIFTFSPSSIDLVPLEAEMIYYENAEDPTTSLKIQFAHQSNVQNYFNDYRCLVQKQIAKLTLEEAIRTLGTDSKFNESKDKLNKIINQLYNKSQFAQHFCPDAPGSPSEPNIISSETRMVSFAH